MCQSSSVKGMVVFSRTRLMLWISGAKVSSG